MAEAENLVAEIEALGEKMAQAEASITKRFIGQKRVVDLVLSTLVCGGHGLLIGLPGLGKTRLVETLGTVMGLDEARVQFTPDLMPADILGSEVLETGSDGSRAFKFIEGPVFCQLLMADEINRASPRTQSALLQAMQERSVTIAGQPHPLPEPFHVLATQNPIEQEGTYPLPEAQLDRFMFLVNVPYPTAAEEREILRRTTGSETQSADSVVSGDDIRAMQEAVRGIPVSDTIFDYCLALTRGTRVRSDQPLEFLREWVAWGAGPRASQFLVLGAKAHAAIAGRNHVAIEDVKAVAHPVLRHRIVTNFAAAAEGMTSDKIIDKLLEAVDPAGQVASGVAGVAS